MKKTVKLTFQVRELMYDIANKAHLIGQAQSAKGAAPDVTDLLQAGGTEAQVYELKRSIARAYNKACSLMGEFMAGRETLADDDLMDTELSSDAQLTMYLHVPYNYDENATPALAEGMHAYLVCTALSLWLSVMGDGSAEMYATLAEEGAAMAVAAVFGRKRPTRGDIPCCCDDCLC